MEGTPLSYGEYKRLGRELGGVILAWLADNLPDGCDNQSASMVTGIAVAYANLVAYEMLKKIDEEEK